MLHTSAFISAQNAPRRNTQTRTQQPDITYTVSMPKPHTHLLAVEMRVKLNANSSAANAEIDLVMPVWTPGSYLVREYARHVQDFAATDASGRNLRWSKTNKNTWRVVLNNAREMRATYSVYANELTVRTNELNDRHAFWNNAALLMYVDKQLAAPATLRVVPFGDWKVATGLPAVAGQTNTFRAENFDVLYDSPVEVGSFKTLEFRVRNVPHRIIIEGDGNYNAERLRADVQKIVETTVQMMGDIPYRDYTFILHLRPTGSGGLEHFNSTALIWSRFRFRPDSDYNDFLSLVAHEYFHVWNVKHIRPDALGPFDYTAENYTRLLWVAEGLTSYYENILLRRAGITSDRDYLNILGSAFQALQDTPGRLEMSLEEASFDAWIKYYRRDENSVNSQVSYYDKGGIVGAMLDLEIRRRSAGARSLDDVMRLLYNEYAKRNRNYTPEDFQRACEQTAGGSLDEFFKTYVRGRGEIPYNTFLETVGLRLDTTGGAARRASERPYLGATLDQQGERLVVTAVRAGTPAYDQGLNTGDQIVASDGARVNRDSFNLRLEEKRPGDEIALTVFRLDDLRTLRVKLGARAEGTYRILGIDAATDAQRMQYQKWIDATFPPAPPASRDED